MHGHLLVVDIESTCWEPRNLRKQSEILQVGMCLMESLDFTTGKFAALSKLPTIYVTPKESEISEFCTQLTGITPETAATLGIPFANACRRIRRVAHPIAWASWGDYDRTMFESQCKRRMVRYPFSETHINAKRLVQRLTGRRMGMDRALEFFGLTLEGRHHDGGDDAYNIARIIRHCFTTEPYAGRVRESLALA